MADQRKRWPYLLQCITKFCSMIELLHALKTAVFNIEAFGHIIMSQQGKRKTRFSGHLYITKNWKFSCVRYAHSQFLCSRVANLAFLKPDLEILAVFWTPLAFFGNLAYCQSDRLGSGKTLSCIFITNLLPRGSITMQGRQNIAKILLLPWKWSMLLIKYKCTTL